MIAFISLFIAKIKKGMQAINKLKCKLVKIEAESLIEYFTFNLSLFILF